MTATSTCSYYMPQGLIKEKFKTIDYSVRMFLLH